MKIEIKNLKHYPALSEETEAFSCRVYVNGRYAFDASNDGKGGCHRYEGDRARIALAEEWARSLPPAVHGVYSGITLAQNLDSVIDGLVYEALSAKELKAKLRNHAVFLVPGQEGVFAAKHMPEEQAAHLHGRENVLNFMPFDEALKVYMREVQSG